MDRRTLGCPSEGRLRQLRLSHPPEASVALEGHPCQLRRPHPVPGRRVAQHFWTAICPMKKAYCARSPSQMTFIVGNVQVSQSCSSSFQLLVRVSSYSFSHASSIVVTTMKGATGGE